MVLILIKVTTVVKYFIEIKSLVGLMEFSLFLSEFGRAFNLIGLSILFSVSIFRFCVAFRLLIGSIFCCGWNLAGIQVLGPGFSLD